MAYTNLNRCRNAQIHVETGWKQLSGIDCSEIIVIGPTDGVYISDGNVEGEAKGHPHNGNAFFVPANEQVVFRGVTHAHSLSAKRGASTDRTLHYRTQYYSSVVQTR